MAKRSKRKAGGDSMATLGARVDDDFYELALKAAASEGMKMSAYLLKAVEEKMSKGKVVDRHQPALFPKVDQDRANVQMATVFDLMRDGQWRSLPEIAVAIGAPDASIPSIGARLRDLRKAQYGSHVVDKHQRQPGYWEYQLALQG
jgi:uncharacterized protein (DUF1778 family)